MNTINESASELQWTGERYIPSINGDIEIEHLHRYSFALNYVSMKDVLDIASGEGYGSNILAEVAKTVVGVDISNEAVYHAQSKYLKPNLRFCQGDCTRIPLANNSIDVVVSFETIEHHDQHDAMLIEIKRVLRPNGLILISTPDRDYHGAYSRDNEFHVKELNKFEFQELLDHHFNYHYLFSQRVRYGSLICPMGTTDVGARFFFNSGDSAFIKDFNTDPEPELFVAFASDAELDIKSISFFDGTNHLLKTISSLRINRDSLQTEVDRVKNTISWKLTKPLRYFWNTALKIFN